MHFYIILNIVCPSSTTYFEFTGVCGTCQSQMTYDLVQKRCVCSINKIQPLTNPSTCQSCSTQPYSPAGAQFCLNFNLQGYTEAHITTKLKESEQMPCRPGQSLFLNLEKKQYECVLDTVIDHQSTYQTESDFNQFCGTGAIYNITMRTCYLVADNNPPVQGNLSDNEYDQIKSAYLNFAMCKTQTSAKACLSLYNLCIIQYNFSATACTLYTSLSTLPADIYKPLFQQSQSLPYVTQQIIYDATQTYTNLVNNTPQLFVHISDINGNIIYKGNAFSAAFSQCAFLRAQQSYENYYMFKSANRRFKSRAEQYGFTNRILETVTYQNDGLSFTTDQQPFFSYLINFQEKCGFGKLNSSIFIELSVLQQNGSYFRVPLYQNQSQATDFTVSRTSSPSCYVLGKLTNSSYLSKIKLNFPIDQIKKLLFAPFITYNLSNFTSNNEMFVEDLTDLSTRLLLQKQPNQFQFDVSYLTNSTQSSYLTFIAIFTVVGVLQGMCWMCKAGGDCCYPNFSCNCAMPIQTLKWKNGEEVQSCSCLHFFEFILYTLGYSGLGSYIYDFAGGLQKLMANSEASLIELPLTDNAIIGYILFLLFFVVKIFSKSTQKVLFFDAVKTDTNTWKPLFVLNKYQDLSKERPGWFSLSFTVALIIVVMMDYFYLATPAVKWQNYPTSINVNLSCQVFVFIFTLTYLASCLIKQIINIFLPSKFIKFEHLCASTQCTVFIMDTKRSCLVIKGKSDENVAEDKIITNLYQISKQSQLNTVFRAMFSNNDQNFVDMQKYLDSLHSLNSQKNKQKKFIKCQQFSEKAIGMHNDILALIEPLSDQMLGEKPPGCKLCDTSLISCDLRGGQGLELSKFQWLNGNCFGDQNSKENNTFHLNPMFRYIMLHGMWFYEMAFCCLSISFFGSICGNMMIGVIISGFSMMIVFLTEQKLQDITLRKLNVISNGFTQLVD